MASAGVVNLTGTVPTFVDRTAARKAAERVFGVRAVANELSVELPTAFRRTDTDIARAVVDALTWDVQVPGTRIKSAVSNGWVTLDGNVEWAFQRDAAARAVRNITGVRGVTSNLIITAKPVSTSDVNRGIKQAPRTATRRAAGGAAWAAPGVKEVQDNLAIGGRRYSNHEHIMKARDVMTSDPHETGTFSGQKTLQGVGTGIGLSRPAIRLLPARRPLSTRAPERTWTPGQPL